MNGRGVFTPTLVEFIPEKLEEGVLYISKRYKTASHLCACGCGLEVVTPLNPAKWRIIEHEYGGVSLNPSVGNWGFACKSHYFITRNRVQWAASMSPSMIAAVQARDKFDTKRHARQNRSGRHLLADGLSEAWAALKRFF